MVFPVNNLFKPMTPSVTRRPLLTSIPHITSPISSRFGGFQSQYQMFWKWYRTSSQLVAVTNIIATDIIGDRVNFLELDESQLGRNKLMSAKKFWRYNRVKETLKAIVYDMIITGDGYGWIGKLSSKDRMKIGKEVADKLSYRFQLKESDKVKLAIKVAQDEDLKKPKKIDYIASSTMQIESDQYDVRGYVQRSNGLEVKFTPEEIVHYRWQTMDGRVEGFSPVEALTKELTLLWFVKGNMLAYMENGGAPGKLFILENTQPGQPAYDRFVENLQAYKDVKGRHGNYVATGKVNVEDLDLKPKDMEYQEMALYLTSSLAYAFGIPVTRIPFLVGKSATSGDSGGMAENGYWNMIAEQQDKIEDLFNGQIGDTLGWHIRFNRKYKQDNVREAQTAQMNAATVSQQQMILREQKMKLSKKKVRELLHLSEGDVEELTEADIMSQMQMTGAANQNLLDNNSVNKEPDNRKRADTKRNVANASANKGASV